MRWVHRRSVRFLALLAVVQLLGCRQQPKRQPFPIGIFDARTPADFAAVSKAGFDTVLTEASDSDIEAIVAAAKRYGVSLVLPPDPFRSASSDRTRGWPIRAWHLQDEPDVKRTSRAQLEKISHQIRLWDPARKQSFVVGQASALVDFANIADIAMVDWYPVPHLPITSLTYQVDTAVSLLPPEKPLWVVVQAMDWRDYPQRVASRKRIGRFPSFEEMRFMAYSAIMHGARGVFFYTFRRPSGSPMTAEPEKWLAVARLGAELHSLQTVFERGALKPLPFQANDHLDARCYEYRGRQVLLLANPNGTAEPIPSALLSERWRLLFEKHRNLTIAIPSLELAPYRVLVFEGS